MDGEAVFVTPLTDGEAAGFLICEPGRPFRQMGLVKFLFSIHEMTS